MRHNGNQTFLFLSHYYHVSRYLFIFSFARGLKIYVRECEEETLRQMESAYIVVSSDNIVSELL